MWSQTYGGQSSDTAWAIIQTADGGYAIAGYTQSFGAGETEFLVIKTDEYGVIPEFPSWIFLPLTMVATLVAIGVKKRFL